MPRVALLWAVVVEEAVATMEVAQVLGMVVVVVLERSAAAHGDREEVTRQ
jgi:hypothetical protein